MVQTGEKAMSKHGNQTRKYLSKYSDH